MPKSHLAIAILIVTLLTSIQPRAEVQKRRTQSIQPFHQIEPFDSSREALPPNYQGFNIETVFKRLSLRSATLSKKEFETTEQHRQRLKKEESIPVIGSRLTVNDLLAFTITRTEIESEYQADKHLLRVAISVGSVQERAENARGMRSLNLRSNHVDEGSYIATNAFGTRIRVKGRRIDAYELACDNANEFGMSKYLRREQRTLGLTLPTDSLVIDMDMDTATAIKAKQNLRAIVLVKLISPYTSKATYYDNATFDNPVSYYQVYYYVIARLVEVWLYDVTSGEIYSKVRPNTL
jgi:hypothetical protein